jgi:hypothetical protein
MKKIKLFVCLNLCFDIFTADTNSPISPINIALNAIQNRANTLPEDVDLRDCINENIAGGSLLHHAIFQGKMNWVENLLRQNADVNQLSTNPILSPLQIAASLLMLHSNSDQFIPATCNRFKIIKLLIENGANPRNPNISEFLPIFITKNKYVNQSIQQIKALTVSRMRALDKCADFLSYIKTTKLKSHEIRALPIYQIYAEHNQPLEAYLEELEQKEKENIIHKRPRAASQLTKPLKFQCTEIMIKQEK